jgi:hypothetical protein
VAWEVGVSDEFRTWYESLSEDEQDSVIVSVTLLEQHGPALGRPHVDTIRTSRYSNMKELRVQHRGRPYRILFIFDTRRLAYLILGGDKTGDNAWYARMVPEADAIYARYLKEIGGESDGS